MKAFRINSQQGSPNEIGRSYFPKKFRQLPLLRIRYKETPLQHKAIVLRGSKYLVKVSVFGENSVKILKELEKCKTLKYFENLEFDPYFCDSSGTELLSRVLNKYKGQIVNLNLVIRRIKTESETMRISECLGKLNRLNGLSIEFPSTQGLCEKNLADIAKSLPKCYLLKSLEVKLVWLESIPQSGYIQILRRFGKLLKLEHIKFHPLTFYTPKNEFKDLEVAIPKIKAKSFDFKSSAKTGWTSMTGDTIQFLPRYIRSFSEAINPIKFSYTLHNYPITMEAIKALSEVIPKLTNARDVSISLENCKLSEIEIFMMAESITRSPQIEQLVFKVIEHGYLDPELVIEVVGCLSSLDFLKKCNLFFRKLKYFRQEATCLSKNLSDLQGIEYILTKESLHVSKIPPQLGY